MGLLVRALQYRHQLIKKKPQGLLRRTLLYLENKKKVDFPAKMDQPGEDEPYLEHELSLDKDETAAEPKKIIAEELLYYKIINDLSKELSVCVIKDNAYQKFNQIISNYFLLEKSALLIYSPEKAQFVCWAVNQLDNESFEKLAIDLEFNQIYPALAREKSLLIDPKNTHFDQLQLILSENDFKHTDFQLWIPFVFSARIIGILLVLKIKDTDLPNTNFIQSLEILGRLNGSLLYNLYQQDLLKKNTDHIKKKLNQDAVQKHDPEDEMQPLIESGTGNDLTLDEDLSIELPDFSDIKLHDTDLLEEDDQSEMSLEELTTDEQIELEPLAELNAQTEQASSIQAIDNETELELDNETELELDNETELELDNETELELDTETELELDTETELELDTETELELDTETELELDTETELELDTETELELDNETELELDNETGPEVRTEMDLELVTETEPELDSDPGEIIDIAEIKTNENGDVIDKILIDNQEIELSELFEPKYHNIILAIKQGIQKSPSSPLAIIKISISNALQLEKEIENLKFETFLNDIQFIVMNTIGTNGFVKIFEDLTIYIVLPNVEKKITRLLIDEITNEMNNMFNEIFSVINIQYETRASVYPDDSPDYLQLFYHLQ